MFRSLSAHSTHKQGVFSILFPTYENNGFDLQILYACSIYLQQIDIVVLIGRIVPCYNIYTYKLPNSRVEIFCLKHSS